MPLTLGPARRTSHSPLPGAAHGARRATRQPHGLAGAFLLVLLLCQARTAAGAKILAMPTTVGLSHQMATIVVAKELAARGHDVSLLIQERDADYHKTHSGERFEGLNMVVVPTPGTTWDNVMELFQASTRMPPLDGMKFISDLLLSICRDDLLSNKELMAKLRGAKYDIVLLDWFFSCGQVIDKLIKPRFPAVRLHVSVAHPLMTEWHHGYDNTVLPGSPLAFSFQMGTSFHSPESTFLDRAANAFTYVLTSVLLRGAYYEPYAKLMLEFGAKDTVIDDVMNLVPMEGGLQDHNLLPPQFKSIGPLTPKPPKPLPEDIASFVEEAEGLMVVSFGTWCGPTVAGQEVLAKALRDVLPAGHRVLWKLNMTDTDLLEAARKHSDPETWMFKLWLPLNDVLAHPKVKMAMIHGGFHTTNEAAFHGVPVLVVPFMGDQPTNSALLGRRGMALEVHKDNLEGGLEEVKTKIKALLEDTRFRSNAKQISKVFSQLNGTKQAADWVEYAVNTDGARHLVWKSWYQLNWLQRNSIDVLLFFAALLSTVVAVVLALVVWLVSKCTGLSIISPGAAVKASFMFVPVVFLGAIQRFFC